jgi:hypothetical protein
MEYSSKPQDWYFEIHEHEDVSCIALSNDSTMLDDELGAHNLPRPIKQILEPLGVFVEGELMESVFEFSGDSNTLKNALIEAGFNENSF